MNTIADKARSIFTTENGLFSILFMTSFFSIYCSDSESFSLNFSLSIFDFRFLPLSKINAKRMNGDKRIKNTTKKGKQTIQKHAPITLSSFMFGLNFFSIIANNGIQTPADKAVDADALKKRLEDILDASNFSPAEKTKARAELDTQILECKDRAKSVYKTYNKNRAFETLKSARQNDGFIDAETMKDDGVARARREADLLGGYEKLDEAGKVEYRGRFYSLLSDISRYSAKADEDGTELATLMKRAQTFPKSSRKELMEAIYNTVNAIPPNGNWTAESVKQFNAKFDDVCKLGKDSHWYTSDKNPELALDFRTRVLTLAKVRNLSLSETVEEMKKDPFYAETIASANRQKALEFIRK